MIAVAAIGSVGETIAPSTKAAAQGSSGTIACATTATATIVSEDEPDREHPDRSHVRAQVAERGEERRPVEERRQHADEHEVGRQLELGHPRDEAEREPAEHEQDRVRDPHPRHEHEQRGAGDEQHEQGGDVLLVQLGQDSPLSRSSRRADSDFSSSRPIPRRISGVFENWTSA